MSDRHFYEYGGKKVMRKYGSEEKRKDISSSRKACFKMIVNSGECEKQRENLAKQRDKWARCYKAVKNDEDNLRILMAFFLDNYEEDISYLDIVSFDFSRLRNDKALRAFLKRYWMKCNDALIAKRKNDIEKKGYAIFLQMVDKFFDRFNKNELNFLLVLLNECGMQLDIDVNSDDNSVTVFNFENNMNDKLKNVWLKYQDVWKKREIDVLIEEEFEKFLDCVVNFPIENPYYVNGAKWIFEQESRKRMVAKLAMESKSSDKKGKKKKRK